MSEKRLASEMTPEQTLDLFKFCEEAAEKAKAHAWAQTTWVLTLNAAILGVSVTFFAGHERPSFFAIELLSAGVGVVLCAFLVYLLSELGGHISHYWSSLNRIAAGYAPLIPFVGEINANAARAADYKVPFPAFCRRLQLKGPGSNKFSIVLQHGTHADPIHLQGVFQVRATCGISADINCSHRIKSDYVRLSAESGPARIAPIKINRRGI